MTFALVIGAGPAGLMAAETLADAGHNVIICDAKPSAGRKLLMAGKSGLNLTKDEPLTDFLSAFGAASSWLEPSLRAFDNQAVQDWTVDLNQQIFTGSSGRVFPKSMKASPLLRSWLLRLETKGVVLRTKWAWLGWGGNAYVFDTPDGHKTLAPAATVFALGGASWPKLGSDAAWASTFRDRDVKLTPFEPANMGVCMAWSDHMKKHFGAPVKNVKLSVGAHRNLGEFVIAADGLEGSLIYQFSSAFRAKAPAFLDLLPNLEMAQIAEKIAKAPRKSSLSNTLRKSLKLPPVKSALLFELGGDVTPRKIPMLLKSLPVPYTGVANIKGAISVAGGVAQSALTQDFMLKNAPGCFCAGEMLDWEAPTGGYLINGCLATGRAAGLGAAHYMSNPQP